MNEKEKMILSHEPVPGFRKIFYIVLIVAVLYLMVIFLFFHKSPQKHEGHGKQEDHSILVPVRQDLLAMGTIMVHNQDNPA